MQSEEFVELPDVGPHVEHAVDAQQREESTEVRALIPFLKTPGGHHVVPGARTPLLD